MYKRAWEFLSDPRSRANYDLELRASSHAVEVADDEIRLDEMSVEDFEDSNEFFYPCRFGDYFTVSSTDLKNMGFSLDGTRRIVSSLSTTDIVPSSILLRCASSSLKIRLTIDGNCSEWS